MDPARAHLDGVTALLQASAEATIVAEGATPPDEGLAVYIGTVPPDAPSIYAAVTVGTPMGVQRRLSDQAASLSCRVSVLHVGDTQREVLWAVGITQAALRRKRPPAPGRASTPMQGGDGQARQDTSTIPAAWVATDVWRFASAPTEETQ